MPPKSGAQTTKITYTTSKTVLFAKFVSQNSIILHLCSQNYAGCIIGCGLKCMTHFVVIGQYLYVCEILDTIIKMRAHNDRSANVLKANPIRPK